PNAIREASLNIESYSLRAGLDAEGLRVRDLGNVQTVMDVGETLRRISLIVEEQVSRCVGILVLGGEHTITLGILEGFKPNYPAVLCFDAHMDLRDEYLGSRVNHATVVRRMCELVGADRVLLVGVRGFTGGELRYARSIGLRFYTSLDVFKKPAHVAEEVKRWIDEFERVYMSIDLDVLDPSQAPAVGNPEPEGLTTTQLLDILWEAFNSPESPRVAGLDIVEAAPPYDSGLTAVQAAKIALEALCLMDAGGR
ncbi:MAG TPA: agmatinase family protein, partial [Calditrichaeota bacterium]|nr:agmatinase family protein [Calditrichota bacterium]